MGTEPVIPHHSVGLLRPRCPLWHPMGLSLFICGAVCRREGRADREAPAPIAWVSLLTCRAVLTKLPRSLPSLPRPW